MTDNLEEIELRSEEVRDVLSRAPNWMIRWGSNLFLGLILIVLFISWIIKYPDIIESEALITTQVPPQELYSRIDGKFDSIYVNDSQKIKKSDILGVIENTANTEDVYFLKSILDTISIKNKVIKFPINEIPVLILGDIETSYAIFENSYSEYLYNKTLNPFFNEFMANQLSMVELKNRLTNLQSQYELNKSELQLKLNDLERNKKLLKKGVISELDYDNKQLEFLDAERSLKSLSVSISQAREAISNARKVSKSTEINRTTEESKLLRNTLQSFNKLKKAIGEWEYKYVLKAEIDGKVTFFNYWNKNQSVNHGDLVFTIIPNSNENYLAKLKAVAQNSGKIRMGQNVHIRLDNYPETEFGMLKGKVTSISLTPDKEGYYHINVSLPKKLITTYNKEIDFKQEMKGTAGIITEDLRLLERLFYQFREIYDR